MAEERRPAAGVVCDFDGTACLVDLGNEISRHFGGREAFEALQARLSRGEIDTRRMIESLFLRVTAGEAELRAFAAERAALRPGFDELLRACVETGTPFLLASGGLRQYIEAALDAHLPPPLRARVEIRANEGLFADRAPLRVRFPWLLQSEEAGCTSCGSCKRIAVAELRARGARLVVGIGDGFADRCLVRAADVAFARRGSALAGFCAEQGIPFTAFDDLEGVAEVVRRGG
jgi:2,3-diketo-5-methylthio-1-phosphopentane phosphatase